MKKYFMFILIICLSFGSGILFGDMRNEESKTNIILKEQAPWRSAENDNDEAKQATLNNLLKHIGFAEEAINKFRIPSPEEAINLWAEGMKGGNGVLQYAVMDPMLQQEFKTYLQHKENISWDTRKDEFQIDFYEIIENVDVSEKIKIYDVKFHYINSQGEVKEGVNKVTIIEEQGKWVISTIR